MTKEYLEELIKCGHEIEFKYNGKGYSITYYGDDRKDYISFCEYHKYTSDVATIDELFKVQRDGVTVLEMWESLDEEKSDYDIF